MCLVRIPFRHRSNLFLRLFPKLATKVFLGKVSVARFLSSPIGSAIVIPANLAIVASSDPFQGNLYQFPSTNPVELSILLDSLGHGIEVSFQRFRKVGLEPTTALIGRVSFPSGSSQGRLPFRHSPTALKR